MNFDGYRITFTIYRVKDGDETAVGFGSSGTSGSVAAAAYEVESIIGNRQWETEPGMPEPGELESVQ